MGRIRTIARRSFLIGSAALLGGVAFGAVMYRRPHKNPLPEQLVAGEAAITPYVLITPDGITLIAPRADKGQGAYSVQAALIAEELDVRLDQVTVDPGLPAPVYYNTALASDLLPIRSTNTNYLADLARRVADAPVKFLGIQITGGSTTVPDGYDKLRHAGAVARETLKAAAARKTGLDTAQLTTKDAHVVLPDGTTLSYTSLAATAAGIEPADAPALRDPSEWRYLGKPMQRLDMVAKSTGAQEYGIDVQLPDLLHAAVRLNPRRGVVISHDATQAETMRGVRSILPITGGLGVIADNTWRAMQAAQAITVEWGPAPYPAGMDAHWQALSDSFTKEQIDSQYRDDGDAAVAERPITAEYRAPYLAHAPLEPINATALVTDTRIDIWTGTQIPRFIQSNISALTGIDTDNIHVHVQMIGGSFGHRLEDQVVRHAVELAMSMKGTPVKLTYSREEDFAQDFTRQIAMARMAGSVTSGNVETCDLGIAMPSIIASQMGRQGFPAAGPDTQIVAGAWDQPFDIPNYRVTGYRAPDLAPISSWRSVGASTNGFFHDCALDELIHAAGADPLAERIRLCNHAPSRKVLEAVGEMSDWGSDMGETRGRGVGFCLSFGVPCAVVVEVTNSAQGIRLDKVFAAADVGRIIDPVNFEAQVSGGVIFGMGHAINCEITYADSAAQQTNYHQYEAMRLYQCPEVTVRGLENGDRIRGIGEPGVPPAAPALANAIFAATGQRIREMPFNKHIRFV
ncbi:molybdopterin cofactor-binding domain-containing protein [uncultured Roseovarius sp.]|uniref:xanthine dehydrogenase family protein molybdopterin-binding subunit n=1 Tax=uncultured Roseovarius sp. TaxID=293344 RepID=UPI002626A97A|nr:molybdopterin cofactor-binding domain-containing protein [uncultured Roseovarius sp.]